MSIRIEMHSKSLRIEPIVTTAQANRSGEKIAYDRGGKAAALHGFAGIRDCGEVRLRRRFLLRALIPKVSRTFSVRLPDGIRSSVIPVVFYLLADHAVMLR
jgi:hypothetical protein